MEEHYENKEIFRGGAVYGYLRRFNSDHFRFGK
jgi:hypothetical protein